MAISSRACIREKPVCKKVHRLSRKGVPDKRRGSTPTPEGVDDIVSALWKHNEWSEVDSSETCWIIATSGEQNHGLKSYRKKA